MVGMKKLFLAMVIGGAALAWGCSSGGGTDDAGTDSGNPGTDSGTTDSGGTTDAGPGKDGGGPDGAPVPVNGCVSFTDFTADGGTITFPSTALPSQYSPNCVAIKVNQSVTWTGSFTSHPLGPKGGDTPTPITATSTGTTATFTFPNAGTFGFGCQTHPSMQGAVKVTP